MAPISPASRPALSPEQLLRYISRVYECDLSNAEQHLKALQDLIQSDPLKGLTQLQQRHLVAIPFSNVVLHYSQHHSISLDPDVLFHKMVERQLGGYCFENTGLFAMVMRTLGFKFYTSAGRINTWLDTRVDTGNYFGWGHLVLIVTIGNSKYIVDTGLGPEGPTKPIPLEHGASLTQIAPAETRVIKDAISSNTDSEQKPWIVQLRSHPNEDWIGLYCFYEIEFLPSDFEVSSFYASQNPRSFFQQVIICAAFIPNEANDDIVGNLWIMKGVVKKNLRGKIETLRTCKNEEERIGALEKIFKIHLQPVEARGIRGTPQELQERHPDMYSE